MQVKSWHNACTHTMPHLINSTCEGNIIVILQMVVSWAKYENGNSQEGNNHLKRCSILLVIREMQNKQSNGIPKEW